MTFPRVPAPRKHTTAKNFHFDIDKHLNLYLPANIVRRFPKPIARFLGYREKPAGEIGNILISIWALVGAFLGLLVVAATYKFSDRLARYYPPVLFASLGATAILDYNTIQSPLAQPRAAIVGHGISAVVGVGIAKLFMLSPDFASLRWLAGPTACGAASFAMAMTNTVHPPGGATAVLAAVDPITEAMGWMFVPFILLGSVLMFSVALLVNNIQRQFPVFWWTPGEVGGWWERRRLVCDVERLGPATKKAGGGDEGVGEGRNLSHVLEASGFKQMIILTPDRVMLPEGFQLETESAQLLQVLRSRLREWPQPEDDAEEKEHQLELVHNAISYGSETTHVEYLHQAAASDSPRML